MVTEEYEKKFMKSVLEFLIHSQQDSIIKQINCGMTKYHVKIEKQKITDKLNIVKD